MFLYIFGVTTILALLLILYMRWEASTLRIDRQDVYLPQWPNGFDGIRILFLSDLHRRKIPENVRAELRQEKFDLVLIGGDITEKGVSFAQVGEQLEFLSSLGLSYFVWGNHDYHVDFRQLDILLREKKVNILDNRAVSFESNGDRLWLVGIDDLSKNRDHLKMALSDIDQPGYKLILCHNPAIVEKLNPADQVHAVFSGHTHGGQICLPGLGPITAKRNSVVSKYLAGKYSLQDGQLTLFVSRGVGTSHVPLRLLAPPELHIFTLRSTK